MDDIIPVGGAQRKNEGETSRPKSFASQPRRQHAESPNSAVIGSAEIVDAASTTEEQESIWSHSGRLPQITSQDNSGEPSQRCLSAEATAEPTMPFLQPQLLLPGTSLPHSVVAATDYVMGPGELKGSSLPIVSGPRSSLPSPLSCVAVPPTSTSSPFSPSAAFSDHVAVCSMPVVEGGRGEPGAVDRGHVHVSQSENCTRLGTFAGRRSGTFHEKQQGLLLDSHDVAGLVAGVPNNEAQANRKRSGPKGYGGEGEQVPFWSKGHGQPLGKHYSRKDGERPCEDLPETYECGGGGPEGTHREALEYNAEDAVLAGAKAMKENQPTCTTQIRADGSTRGNNWEKVETHIESNSVRGNNAAVGPMTGLHRPKPLSRVHVGRSVLADSTNASRSLVCGDVRTPQNCSASSYTPPSVSAPACSTRPTTATGGVVGGTTASGGICEQTSRPFSELCKYSEDCGEYLQNMVRCGPMGERLVKADAEGGGRPGGDAEPAKCPTDPAKSHKGEHREKILSDQEIRSAHATESENTSQFRSRSDEASATTTVEASRASSMTLGEIPQNRPSPRQGNGAVVPNGGGRPSFTPASADGGEALNAHCCDAANKGRRSVDDQGLPDVVSLQPHLNTAAEGRSCLPTRGQRKHSMEGLPRSERSTAAGSYCEILDPAPHPCPSKPASDSTDSTTSLRDFCVRNEHVISANVADSETTLVERQLAPQETHATQGSTSSSSATPCYPLRDARERNTNESTETTLSSHRCDQDNPASVSPRGQTTETGMEPTGKMQLVRGHAGGEVLRAVTLTQQQQQRQQQLARRQLQQRFERNLLEQYYRQQQVDQQQELQQLQLGQQNLRQQHQLEQQELRKQQLEQQHLRQQLQQQQQHHRLRQPQLEEPHMRQHIFEHKRQQKRQQQQQTHVQEKLPLKQEYLHQQQHLEQLQRQQELERQLQVSYSVGGWRGQRHGQYAAAASTPGVPSQVAADSYESMLQQAATRTFTRGKRGGGSGTGEEARAAVAGGEQARSGKADELSISGKSTLEELVHGAKAMGGNSMSHAEHEEASPARAYKRNAVEEHGGAIGRCPAGGVFNSSAANERNTNRCRTQDGAAAAAGNTWGRSGQHEEKQETQGRAGGAAAATSLNARTSTADGGGTGEEFMQRKTNGSNNSSSSDTEGNDDSHISSSQEALVEKCCEDIWYHHGAKCYVVASSHTGERKFFLFSEKSFGKELAQGLAIACQKNRLTPEQLALAVPLRLVKDAPATAVVNCVSEGLKTCSVFATADEQPTSEGSGAGARAAETAGREEGVLTGSWKHEAQNGSASEADTFLSRHQQQHHTMLLRRQQQQQWQHPELRQQQALRHQQQQEEMLQQGEEQQRQQQQQELRQKRLQELRHQQGEEAQQHAQEIRQHASKEDITVLPQDVDLMRGRQSISQQQEEQLRKEEHLVQQQHQQSFYEQQEEFLQRQQHDALMQQRQQRETQMSAAQYQFEWDAAHLLDEKGQRAAHHMNRATTAATVAGPSPFEHPSPCSDEHLELLRTEERQHQQQEETSCAADEGEAFARLRRTKSKEEDAAAATSIATRVPRKRTLSRRAADIDRGSTAPRKRPRNTMRSGGNAQDECTAAAAEAYKAGSKETPHGVWFNSHTKSWTCATVGPRRQLLVFSSARYGFEAARALAVEARIRSVQALQEQQQQQVQQQEQQQQQKQNDASQQRLQQQQQQEMQEMNTQQGYLQSEELYGHEQGWSVGGAESSRGQQKHGGEQDMMHQQQQYGSGWSDKPNNNNSNRTAEHSDDLWNSDDSGNVAQTRGSSCEQCIPDEAGEAVTAKKGKEVEQSEAWKLRNTSVVDTFVGEPTESKDSSYRCVPEMVGCSSTSSDWSLCDSNSSGSTGMTEKEEQLLYAGKAAIGLVLSDLLEVCLPQLHVLSAHIQDDLRICIDSALWRVQVADHPTQLQPFFNLFGSCFLRAKTPSSLPVNLRVQYFEALSGLRLPVPTEEQQQSGAAAQAGGATDVTDETKNSTAAD